MCDSITSPRTLPCEDSKVHTGCHSLCLEYWGGKLTDEEYQLMREHVRIGARILEPIEAYAGIIPVVLHHHEYYDGSGYPDNLSGEDNDLGARIFTVAVHYDALISDRPYRAGLPRETVIGFIKEDSGTKFDPKVVDAFLEVMAQEDREAVSS